MLQTYQETIFFFLLVLLLAGAGAAWIEAHSPLSHPLLGTNFEAQEDGGRPPFNR